ncbi:hypothetical protein ZWY2020_017002 [Hordeum vulgare]|nr:hypothetical protein ZWY2020_017002 [Hordeum vulgare]
MATATATASRPSGPVLSITSYRSASPTRVNLPARSPGKSVSVSSPKQLPTVSSRSRRSSCMCSPTNHPGSFRCSLHKERKQGSSKPASRRQPRRARAAPWPLLGSHGERALGTQGARAAPAAQPSLQHRGGARAGSAPAQPALLRVHGRRQPVNEQRRHAIAR